MAGDVVLVSGGIDSLITHHIIGGTPLFINYGQKYAHKELKAVHNLYDNIEIINIDGIPPTTTIFIESRNLMLASIATRYAPNIWMGGVKGEYTKDKTPQEFEFISEVLTRYSSRKIKVRSPIWELTKPEAVEFYIRTGGDPDKILNTVSCYSGSPNECRYCDACRRRSEALKSWR